MMRLKFNLVNEALFGPVIYFTGTAPMNLSSNHIPLLTIEPFEA